MGIRGYYTSGFLRNFTKNCAVLNPDTAVEPGWLYHMVQALEANPRAALAAGKILMMEHPEVINTCGLEITYSGLCFCRGLGEPRERYNQTEEVFGVSCETHNDGDIIVLYDRLANRWFMSQFGIFTDDANWHQCVAVSATSDPLGAWYRYDFLASETKLNDYPKFGVWPDAYYMAANQFDEFNFNYAGQGVWALERDAMLLGLPASMVYFDLFGVDPKLGGMLPADMDGLTLPPNGAPNPFVQFDDDAFGNVSQDQLQVWEFHVDWTTPVNSTFTHPVDLATDPFDAQICPAFRGACIDQPNGLKVEDLADRLMYRLQYRNKGSYESLVSNHTVDADGNDHAGVHWFELRKSGGAWSLYQDGVYAPDADHRWMGSVAMDHVGNIALGYSVSSSVTYPSVRYTGRLAGDPLGTLPQGEASLVAGSGAQNGHYRWGDYSMMALEPQDDCTFWCPNTGDAQTTDPKDTTRQTTIKVPITEYEWWLIRWNDNEILCEILIDHEGLPTNSEVLKSCGIDLYQDWQNTPPCKQISRGTAGPNVCSGLYLYQISSQPTQKEVIVELPEASVWVSLENCSPIPPDNLCTTLPSLLLLGEEPLPNETITAIQGTYAGKFLL